jgi:hypothetical protein
MLSRVPGQAQVQLEVIEELPGFGAFVPSGGLIAEKEQVSWIVAGMFDQDNNIIDMVLNIERKEYIYDYPIEIHIALEEETALVFHKREIVNLVDVTYSYYQPYNKKRWKKSQLVRDPSDLIVYLSPTGDVVEFERSSGELKIRDKDRFVTVSHALYPLQADSTGTSAALYSTFRTMYYPGRYPTLFSQDGSTFALYVQTLKKNENSTLWIFDDKGDVLLTLQCPHCGRGRTWVSPTGGTLVATVDPRLVNPPAVSGDDVLKSGTTILSRNGEVIGHYDMLLDQVAFSDGGNYIIGLSGIGYLIDTRNGEIVHEFAREKGYFISGWAINEDRGIVGILFDHYQFSTKTNHMTLKFYHLNGEPIAETSLTIEGSRISTESRENFIIYNKGRNFAFGLKNLVYGGEVP